MNEVTQWVSGCITTALLLGILIGGPIKCAMNAQEEATKRVQTACAGDLKSDAVRAAACILATTDAKSAGI